MPDSWESLALDRTNLVQVFLHKAKGCLQEHGARIVVLLHHGGEQGRFVGADRHGHRSVVGVRIAEQDRSRNDCIGANDLAVVNRHGPCQNIVERTQQPGGVLP